MSRHVDQVVLQQSLICVYESERLNSYNCKRKKKQ